jgi:hypothetical protein
VASTNVCETKEIAMKQIAIKHVALIAGLFAASSASATNYEYTAHFDYVRKPALADWQIDPQLQIDTATCDATVGDQYSVPSASYRACMLQHGWKYRFSTRTIVRAAPAESLSWSSNDQGPTSDINDPNNPNNPNNSNSGAAAADAMADAVHAACGWTC